MSKLIFDSLEIRNFRGLKEMKIEKLGRVNLIVGKNNVGKTSVLEALSLYSKPGDYWTLIELLQSRDQLDRRAFLDEEQAGFGLRFTELFYQEPRGTWKDSPVIQIGKARSPDETLSFRSSTGEDMRNLSYPMGHYLHYELKGEKYAAPIWVENKSDLDRFNLDASRAGFKEPHSLFPMIRISTEGLNATLIGRYWDRIALTEQEQDVLDGLRLISDEVERLILKPVFEGAKDRVPFVKMSGQNGAVSLRSLGDGMNRLFGVILALVNTKDGMCLVDEIENGLHHSVQPEVWKLIFTLASKLNVQVFATTHSYECISAFQEAAKESEEEGILIGLLQKKGRFFVGEYSENELGIAVEGNIEVRG